MKGLAIALLLFFANSRYPIRLAGHLLGHLLVHKILYRRAWCFERPSLKADIWAPSAWPHSFERCSAISTVWVGGSAA